MGLNKLEGIMETKMSMGHKLLVVATIAAVFTPAAGGRLAVGAEYVSGAESPADTNGFDPSAAGLSDYLAYAARWNPGLKAAFYGWKAAAQKTGFAGAWPNPTFSYSYFVENVETRVGPQNQVFRLRQSFPWFGTLGTRKDAAGQAAEAAYQKFESKKLELFYEVKAAYYEYYYLGREISITRDNLELLKFWESVVRAKYRVAAAPQPDVLKAQVELAILEDRLLTLEEELKPAAARLIAVLNLPGDVSLPVPAEIYVAESDVNAERILPLVLADNPDLKFLNHLTGEARAGQKLARKVSKPSFFVGIDYIDTGDAAGAGIAESGKDAVTASVGISLPLWFGANKAKELEADARYRQAQNVFADARNRLASITSELVFLHNDALRKVRLYRDGLLPKAKQSLELSYTAYRAGEMDFLEVLDAQRQLLDIQIRYERARTDLAVKQAEIERLTGKEPYHEQF